MPSFKGTCQECRRPFTYSRETPSGHPRLYCDDCRGLHFDKSATRRIETRVKMIAEEVHDIQDRIGQILDRIEGRQKTGAP